MDDETKKNMMMNTTFQYGPQNGAGRTHKHKEPSYKIDFFTPTQIDSIPKDHRFGSMLNRKTIPGGKLIPPRTTQNSEHKNNTNYYRPQHIPPIEAIP